MQLTDAEWRVMDAVWKKHPASVREVHEALLEDTGWAYTTVKTMLTRLAEKGALSLGKDGTVSLFSPLVTRDAAQRTAVSTLLSRAFDGTVGGLFQHLLGAGELGPKERAEIRRLLDESAKAKARPKAKG
ncbi:MAG: BlaI/MecI/CopY family transcriptional regulator [Acidobacteria bacterium]|nr:BlaI/MecI/CopY family transcriptional regulator [Acidobacteriota bacterium]